MSHKLAPHLSIENRRRISLSAELKENPEPDLPTT
jgi:hypothetical protein